MGETESATTNPAPRILVADDQRDILEALRLLLKAEGYATVGVTSPRAALEALDEAKDQPFDALLMDLNYARDTTSGAEGLDLLNAVRAAEPRLPIVVMTAWATVEVAVEAMRRGARDFLEKPWDNNRLISILRNQIELARALDRSERLAVQNRTLLDDLRRGSRKGAGGDVRPRMIAESRVMRPVLEMVERIGPSDANVLITGEHGTGKGLLARVLHSASNRASKPLITVDTGSLAESIFESELFGHVRGAYTDAKEDRAGRFELADGGTLLLDEIANVPLQQQAKLLRAVETGEVERIGSGRTRRIDVRVLSATNADLDAEIEAGRFRRDLLFRLNTVHIHLPPLVDRREDIPPLAAHFLTRHARRYRKEVAGFAEDAVKALLDHSWPGNVRELDHAIERGVLMARNEQLVGADLALGSPSGTTGVMGMARGTGESNRSGPSLEDLPLEDVERVMIEKALARENGNIKKAAEALGLSRGALYRRLEKYGL